MPLRLFLARIVSALCMVAVMMLAPQIAQGSYENLQHTLHSDTVASDGGWVIAACDHVGGPCAPASHGGSQGDGHHHHGGDTHATALLSADPVLALVSLRPSMASPALTPQPDDADLGRPGRVPRASIRLS